MTRSPLVSRPGYGEGGAATPVSESKLPSGDPGGKGLSLDPDIPGSSTFAKPSEEGPREPETKDETIKRVDDADDLLKDRSQIDTREENADKHDGIGYVGEGPWDSSPKTKYPYRDGRPNSHDAAVFVREAFLASVAPTCVLVAGSRVASTGDELIETLSQDTREKASSCSVKVKRAKEGRWLFAVQCGNGAKVVTLEAKAEGKLASQDLKVSCSCPAWQWQGPEYHAKREGYLEGTLQGTGSAPREKDPHGANRVCKHVAAVLSHTKGWSRPPTE